MLKVIDSHRLSVIVGFKPGGGGGGGVGFFLVTFGQICNFRDPNLVTFFLCICLILNEEHSTSHLQCKHSGTFANRKYEKLSYTKTRKCATPF